MALFGKKNGEGEMPENENIPTAESQPKRTVGLDFNRYFLADRRIFLENISYETTKPETSTQGYKLTGKDTVVAQLLGNTGVKITYNRTLKFEPEGPFVLSISFGVMLVFNPATRDEVDWKTVDMATEFRKNCVPLVANISSRISLLVGEITSASGNTPVIIGMMPGQPPKQNPDTL